MKFRNLYFRITMWFLLLSMPFMYWIMGMALAEGIKEQDVGLIIISLLSLSVLLFGTVSIIIAMKITDLCATILFDESGISVKKGLFGIRSYDWNEIQYCQIERVANNQVIYFANYQRHTEPYDRKQHVQFSIPFEFQPNKCIQTLYYVPTRLIEQLLSKGGFLPNQKEEKEEIMAILACRRQQTQCQEHRGTVPPRLEF